MIFLYFLLFIVCLSTLIMVHEAGHLITAKIFNVYCFEYAIGFGPKLFSFKRKKGETFFSLRAIPFGGFVSMYGEEATIPEGMEIPKERSLLSKKKWQRAIIYVAGVTMNFILALTIFFVYEIAFPTYTARIAHVTVKKDSIAAAAGLKSKDYLYSPTLSYDKENYFVFYDDSTQIEYGDSSVVTAYFGYNYYSMTLKDTSVANKSVAFEVLTFGNIDSTYPAFDWNTVLTGDFSGEVVDNGEITGYLRASKATPNKEGKNIVSYTIKMGLTENYLDDGEDKLLIAETTVTPDQYKQFKLVPMGSEITLVGDMTTIDSKNKMVVTEFEMPYPNLVTNLLTSKKSGQIPVKILLNTYVLDENTPSGRGVAHPFAEMELESKSNRYALPKDFGLSMQLDQGWNGFGKAVKYTFTDFGYSASAIFRGLGSLFTSKEGWENVGGIIAIGVSTTQVLEQNGFGTFLFYWGLISVNLGIVNLFPFPGLDGWQLLVVAVEGIFRKEIPAKVKNIISIVGVAILFALMVLILIKDLIAVV